MHKICINGPKKVQSSIFFLSTEKYEQSLSFLKQVCSNIEAVKGTVKLYAVFPHKEPNTIWIRNMSCFSKKCFNDGFMPESICKGWNIANLHKLSNEFGNKDTIPVVGKYVAAIYDWNIYVGKRIEVDKSEAHVTLFQHSGKIECQKKKTNSGYHLIK